MTVFMNIDFVYITSFIPKYPEVIIYIRLYFVQNAVVRLFPFGLASALFSQRVSFSYGNLTVQEKLKKALWVCESVVLSFNLLTENFDKAPGILVS